jgi:hypothetical protein
LLKIQNFGFGFPRVEIPMSYLDNVVFRLDARTDPGAAYLEKSRD